MRDEAEIREALRLLVPGVGVGVVGSDGEKFAPMNAHAVDLLHWVLGEASGFGDALDAALARFKAVRRAHAN